MMIIKGGETNGVVYSCMYDPKQYADRTKNKDGEDLLGVYGIATNLNDAPSMLWFDSKMNFVEGELLHNCINCTWCGHSGGGFFRECLSRGFQINDATTEWCEDIDLIQPEDGGMSTGAIVKVTRRDAYRYGYIGRVVGFTKNGKMAFVQFEQKGNKIQFYLESLKVMHSMDCENLFNDIKPEWKEKVNKEIEKYLKDGIMPRFSTLGRFKRVYVANGKFANLNGQELFEKDLHEYIERQKKLS